MGLPYISGGAFGPMAEIKDGGHRFARWEVKNPKTGQTVVVFFNVDAFSSKTEPR